MKFIKGVSIFLVLCLAAYGAFALLQKEKPIDLSNDEIIDLERMGISVTNGGQATDAGLSGMFDAEGVIPVGVTTGNASSSAPPSFMNEPTTSLLAPPYAEAAPQVAMSGIELQPAPDFFAPPMEVTPLPPVEPIPASSDAPLFDAPLFDAPLFDAPLFDAPPFELPTIPATESPPPVEESWNGPASDISVSPPQELLQPFHSPAARTLSHVDEKIVHVPVETYVRKIEPEQASQANTTQGTPFSAVSSIPTETAPVHYTQTAARQPLTFEPVKPTVSPNAPMVTFAVPKRMVPTEQATTPQPSSPSLPPSAVHPEVKQIGTPRLIDNSPNLALSAQPAIQEAVERFVQSQRQLAESGEPDKIRLALVQLSQLYEHSQLGEAERTMMQPILDALALKVIYAKDAHILESPHRVKPGETIETIAKDFNLTPALLRKINGLAAAQEPSPGTMLKVLYGQFDARISVKRKELTLLLGGLYAGRFPFLSSGIGLPMRSGEFVVTHKADRMLALNNGWILAAAHVSDATIIFADQDAREIFDILSEQSVIVLE